MAGSIDTVQVTEEERNVMRECKREAFWYRSLPAALLSGDLKANKKLGPKIAPNAFQDSVSITRFMIGNLLLDNEDK